MKELRYSVEQREIAFWEAKAGNLISYNLMFVETMLQGITDYKQCNYKANVLILADRLNGIGIGLQYYLTRYTKLNVCGVASDIDMALKMSDGKTINILIIIGYQRKEDNYQIIEVLKSRNSLTQIIFWASIDTLTKSLYRQYHMDNFVGRNDPVQGLVSLINTLQENASNYIAHANRTNS